MNNHMLRPVRRIVTGYTASGESCIIEDGASPAVKTVPQRPGYVVTNVWRTSQTPSAILAHDSIGEHAGVLPPSGGTVIRVIDIPAEPDDPKELEELLLQTFRSLYPDATHETSSARHAGMHKTDTVDYAIMIEGEVTAIMDHGETVMRAGDILIQRGTNHAWANRSGKPCRIAFVLIAAE